MYVCMYVYVCVYIYKCIYMRISAHFREKFILIQGVDTQDRDHLQHTLRKGGKVSVRPCSQNVAVATAPLRACETF